MGKEEIEHVSGIRNVLIAIWYHIVSMTSDRSTIAEILMPMSGTHETIFRCCRGCIDLAGPRHIRHPPLRIQYVPCCADRVLPAWKDLTQAIHVRELTHITHVWAPMAQNSHAYVLNTKLPHGNDNHSCHFASPGYSHTIPVHDTASPRYPRTAAFTAAHPGGRHARRQVSDRTGRRFAAEQRGKTAVRTRAYDHPPPRDRSPAPAQIRPPRSTALRLHVRLPHL